MTGTLIAPDQDFAVWAVLLGLTAFGFWCERYPWGRKYSGVMIMMMVGLTLSNLRVIPAVSPVYDTIWEYLVPLAIALMLLQANLRKIVQEAGPVLLAFGIGSAAVVAGTVVGITLLDLGEHEAQLAGVMSATYIGGSLNFAAVAEVTGFRDSSILTAAVAADNIATNIHFLFLLLLPGLAWFVRVFNGRGRPSALGGTGGGDDRRHRIPELDIAGLLFALTTAFALVAAGNGLSEWLAISDYSILVITALAIALGSLAPRLVARMSGHFEAGQVLIFVFLASIAVTADIWQLIGLAPVLFVLCCVIIAVHLLILFPLGRLLRLKLEELMMGSAVCIGGQASAPPIASVTGLRELMIPGILAGSLGNAVGSFIGVSITQWLSA